LKTDDDHDDGNVDDMIGLLKEMKYVNTFHREVRDEKLIQQISKSFNSRAAHMSFSAERHLAAKAPREPILANSHSPPSPETIPPLP
jgi:hypothetical protein